MSAGEDCVMASETCSELDDNLDAIHGAVSQATVHDAQLADLAFAYRLQMRDILADTEDSDMLADSIFGPELEDCKAGRMAAQLQVKRRSISMLASTGRSRA